MNRILKLLAAGLVGLGVSAWSLSGAQEGQYSALFDSLKPGLFTVEVFDRVSNNKNAIGSAFALSDDGLMATNYHVVSEFVLDPERYGLRFRDAEGDTGTLSVAAVDVLHDLALVRMDPDELPDTLLYPFRLAEAAPRNGETVLALGNPYDIGISIVPGTYNGLLKNQYRKNIHFTGALNPGMSGGPAVNTEGEVIGINVAGAGNSVSFLVPVENLARLVESSLSEPATLESMRSEVTNRLIEHQSQMLDELMAGDWSLEAFGPLMIPREIKPWLSCSGSGLSRDPDMPWQESHSNCTLNDRIFLSRSLDTGPVELIFGWYRSDSLNSFQLSRVFEQNTFMPFNRSDEDDVTDFECTEDWVDPQNLEPVVFKSTYCVRGYLDYPGLYDVLFVARAQRAGPEALHIHYTLSGVGRDKAEEFQQHLMGVLRWKS